MDKNTLIEEIVNLIKYTSFLSKVLDAKDIKKLVGRKDVDEWDSYVMDAIYAAEIEIEDPYNFLMENDYDLTDTLVYVIKDMGMDPEEITVDNLAYSLFLMLVEQDWVEIKKEIQNLLDEYYNQKK